MNQPALPESLTLTPFVKPLSGQKVYLPGSKSITNRTLLLAALNAKPITLQGVLISEDTELMLECLGHLGVKIETLGDDTVRVHGVGGVFPVKAAELYVGTAGTVARLLISVLGVMPDGCYSIDGSEVMHGRPMKGLTDMLQSLGCEIDFHATEGSLPFTLKPVGFKAHEVMLDASQSSQVLSGALMAAPLAKADLSISLSNDKVRKPYVVMTQRLIRNFGGPEIQVSDAFNHFEVKASEGYRMQGDDYRVESDASAASYFLALPRVVGGALDVFHFNERGLQGDAAFIEICRTLGAQAEVIKDEGNKGVTISYTGTLGHPLDADFYPISDTFMTLAAISPLLGKPVKIRGLAHTRKQESDRVSAMTAELEKLGQEVEEQEDSLHIFPDIKALREVAREGISIKTYKDHRIAMSFAILGSLDVLGDGMPWMTIRNPACVEKTFPRFFEVLETLRLETLNG